MSTSSKINNRVRRNLNFSAEEISALIQVWGSPDIQRKFSLGLTRHSLLYEEISAFMKAMGYERAADALQTKVANLKSKYYVEKSTSTKSGSSPSTWIHFEEMHRVLGSRPLANDGCVSDSLRASTPIHEDNPLLDIDESEDSMPLEDANDVNSGCSTSCHDSSSSPPGMSSPDTMPRLAKNTFVVKKTKRPQTDNSILSKLLENDKRIIDLTEKRMKLENETRVKHENMLEAATNFFNFFARGQALNLQSPPSSSIPQSSQNVPFPQQTKSVPYVHEVQGCTSQVSTLTSPASVTRPERTKSVALVYNDVPGSSSKASSLNLPAKVTRPEHTKLVPIFHNPVKGSTSQTFRLTLPATVTGPEHTHPVPIIPVQKPASQLPRQTGTATVKPGTVIRIKQPSTLEQQQKPIVFKTITFKK